MKGIWRAFLAGFYVPIRVVVSSYLLFYGTVDITEWHEVVFSDNVLSFTERRGWFAIIWLFVSIQIKYLNTERRRYFAIIWLFVSIQIKDVKNARSFYIWFTRMFVIILCALDIFIILFLLFFSWLLLMWEGKLNYYRWSHTVGGDNNRNLSIQSSL